jgi:hypothetical protein
VLGGDLPVDDLDDDEGDYEAGGPFRFVGIVEGDRDRRDDVRCLDAHGRSAAMLDVYRADSGNGEGRGYIDDVHRQLVEAGYRAGTK